MNNRAARTITGFLGGVPNLDRGAAFNSGRLDQHRCRMDHKLMTFYLSKIREHSRIAEEEAKTGNFEASIFRITDALAKVAELIDQSNRPSPPPYR